MVGSTTFIGRLAKEFSATDAGTWPVATVPATSSRTWSSTTCPIAVDAHEVAHIDPLSVVAKSQEAEGACGNRTSTRPEGSTLASRRESTRAFRYKCSLQSEAPPG